MQGLYPVALAMMVAQNLDPVVAWAKAIVRERKLCGAAACKAAVQIVVRALAWAFSTSDVERLFRGGMIDAGCRITLFDDDDDDDGEEKCDEAP